MMSVLPLVAIACGGERAIEAESSPSDQAAALTGTLPSVSVTAPVGSTGSTPTIQWTAVSNADAYRVWVSDLSGTRENVLHTAADADCAGGVGTCSAMTVSTLKGGAASVWVRAENEAGVGTWGSGRSFTVSTPDPLPVSPSGVITDTTPSFVWNSSGAANYQLWVNDKNANRVNQPVASLAASCAAGQATCSFDPAVALALGPGKWWIRSQAGVWSAARTFMVAGEAAIPASPSLTSPIGNASVNDPPTFVWAASPTATSYELQVDINGTTVVATTVPASACSGSSCSKTPAALNVTGPGRWWLRAVNSAGSSNWSSPGAFVQAAAVPMKRVFVTSTMHTGALGGLAGADGICATRATAAGLPGTYLPWLSVGAVSPRTRFTRSTVPYRLVTGTQVADNWTDLTDGTLDAPIDRDEMGASTGGEVWTNTSSNGAGSGTPCTGFTATSGSFPVIGIAGFTDSRWSSWYQQFCDRNNVRLFCFQQ